MDGKTVLVVDRLSSFPMKRNPLIKNLLRWFRIHGRDLPWRNIDDPYRIFISEIMLQQTQVSRVMDFYTNWLKIFPTWESLAKAKTPKLLNAWAGLGYNRRALYLRESARNVMECGVPKTIEEWRTLKGVGPYTASAVYAFTAHKPAFAVDTNIRRVVGRAVLGIPFPTTQEDKIIVKELQKQLTQKDDWLALHAFMDLGSSICLSRSPSCSDCPLKNLCRARGKMNKTTNSKKKRGCERIQNGKKFPDRIYRGKILSFIRLIRT
jgi:A/G-specific adenine glycosylase